MNTFETLEQLKSEFTKGVVAFPDDITVANIEYKLRGSSQFSLEEMISKDYKGVIVYSTGAQNCEEAKAAGLNEWLSFVWAANNLRVLQPVDVRPMTSERAIVEGESIEEASRNREDNLIGDKVSVRFTSLPGTQAVKGKVDTGAEICSLHVDNWTAKGGKVQFISRELSPNTITMPLYDHQAIKSASGVQYRPIVEMNIRINDRLMSGILFNLADRSAMDFPVLVGQNALEKGKFLIDPSMRENETPIDWIGLQEDIKDIIVESKRYDPEKTHKIYQLLKDNDVTFNELIRHIRTEVVTTLDDLEY